MRKRRGEEEERKRRGSEEGVRKRLPTFTKAGSYPVFSLSSINSSHSSCENTPSSTKLSVFLFCSMVKSLLVIMMAESE